MKKKAGKSKATRSMKNLPAKPLKSKAAKGVKGGATGPSENITFEYGGQKILYTPQK